MFFGMVWNLERSFFRFVTLHASVRQMNGHRQTAFSSLDRVCIACSAVEKKWCRGLGCRPTVEPRKLAESLRQKVRCNVLIYRLPWITLHLWSSENAYDRPSVVTRSAIFNSGCNASETAFVDRNPLPLPMGSGSQRSHGTVISAHSFSLSVLQNIM